MKEFLFGLGDTLTIKANQAKGEVIARAQYSYAEPCYQLRYVDSKNDVLEAWFTESALET